MGWRGGRRRAVDSGVRGRLRRWAAGHEQDDHRQAHEGKGGADDEDGVEPSGQEQQDPEGDERAEERADRVHRPVDAEAVAQVRRGEDASAIKASRGAVRMPLPTRSSGDQAGPRTGR